MLRLTKAQVMALADLSDMNETQVAYTLENSWTDLRRIRVTELIRANHRVVEIDVNGKVYKAI